MPDESCRRCGGLLLDFLICGECRAPIQFICRICAHKTLPRIHDQICFRIDDIPNSKTNMSINFERHTTNC
ncbi:MAG: hypothetical protein OEM18_02795 [Nitrosopumilus sp.]|nr:hypothetical protein [Nitrosopumilus sp.]MDH3502823.1 hypothetical protein [Nitrosopumilus sp.]